MSRTKSGGMYVTLSWGLKFFFTLTQTLLPELESSGVWTLFKHLVLQGSRFIITIIINSHLKTQYWDSDKGLTRHQRLQGSGTEVKIKSIKLQWPVEQPTFKHHQIRIQTLYQKIREADLGTELTFAPHGNHLRLLMAVLYGRLNHTCACKGAIQYRHLDRSMVY